MVVMAHGLNSVMKRANNNNNNNNNNKSETKTGIGSRRIFPPHFKLQVLDSYRNDADCKGNQRATARKYGIHRRQIQKWLQAENNLRNSVGGGKGSKAAECEARKCGIESALSGHRQRDDSAADAYSQCSRVPALSPAAAYVESVPLDFTARPAPLSDLPAPMDLSLKRPISIAPGDTRTPVFNMYLAPHLPPTPPHTSTPHLSPSPVHSPPLCLAQQPDPDIWDLSTKTAKRKEPPITTTPKPPKLFKPYLDDLHDNSNSSEDSKPTCCTPYYNYDTYTLHELQPKTYYYHPINKSYLYPHEAFYDDSYLLNNQPLKQRQSYSLDFKLRAIECYYQDEMCRGNQRAVASKYNIHRRQVQKWLKQEEELRQRNECVKHLNAVR